MNIRRRVDLRTVVIEADAIEDRRLSAAAVGILAFLAAGDDDARAQAVIQRRFRMTAAELDACLAELRDARHLAEDVAPPPARRSATAASSSARGTARNPLTQGGRLLLHALARRADPAGAVTPLNRELAADTGQHPRTVHRNLAALEAGGFLRREIDRGDQDGNTRRRIYLASDPPAPTPQTSTMAPRNALQ